MDGQVIIPSPEGHGSLRRSFEIDLRPDPDTGLPFHIANIRTGLAQIELRGLRVDSAKISPATAKRWESCAAIAASYSRMVTDESIPVYSVNTPVSSVNNGLTIGGVPYAVDDDVPDGILRVFVAP